MCRFCVEISFRSFGQTPRCTTAGPYNQSKSSFFKKPPNSLPKYLYYFAFPWAMNESSYYSSSLPEFRFLRILNFEHSNKHVVVISILKTFISLRTYDVDHLCAAAAAAKSLQSCLTLWDPIDGSPPDSPIPGILQARTLEWVAIFFSNAWKWKVKVKSLSCAQLLATPWTGAYRLLLPWDFPGKSTGVGCHCLLHGSSL